MTLPAMHTFAPTATSRAASSITPARPAIGRACFKLYLDQTHTLLRPKKQEMAACGPVVAETCSKPVARRSLRLSTFHPPCASLSITVQHGHGIKDQVSVFAVVRQSISCFLQSLSSVSIVSTIAIIPITISIISSSNIFTNHVLR